MKLFEVNEFGEAVVNKPWISLIPEFRELFRRPDRKVSYELPQGRKYLVYIYFMYDFGSPLRDWNVEKREEEALRYSGLEKSEVKLPKLKEAIAMYERLQIEKCRALKSYRAAQIGLDKMDEYFKTVDFDKTDKQGKLLYTPNQYTDNLGKVNKAYDELEKLAKRVDTELAQTTVGIRGMAELGDRELQRGSGTPKEEEENTWSEEAPEEATKQIQWRDVGDLLNS